MNKSFASMIVALVVALSFPSPASAQDDGVLVDQAWYYCEYREWPSNEVQYRYGTCENGDTIVVSTWLVPGNYFQTAVVMATAMNQDASNVAWLERPKFVRFLGRAAKFVRVKLRGIHLWTNDPAKVEQTIYVQVTPVSTQNATISDEVLLSISWRAGFYVDDGEGKG